MLRIPTYLMVLLLAWIPVACEVQEEDPLEPGAVIDGDPFQPAFVRITRDSTSLEIQMVSGNRSLDFRTSDTISGRYLIDTISFKTSVVYQAQLIYNDRNTLYTGVSGVLELQQAEDVYSGTFESVVQSAKGGRVVIREGVFNDVAAGTAP